MLVTVLGGGITACSLSADTRPSEIVLPPTDVLSTESATETTTSVSRAPISATAQNLPDWTIGRVIALAPRVDNSRYRQGSVTPQSRLRKTSGFHFSTPDRAVNCSTGANDPGTLSCRINSESSRGPRPRDTPTSCSWAPNLVTLNTDGPQHGACANQHPVLFRSSILAYRYTISVSRFSCLSDTTGLFCLESESNTGFAITPTGYRKIFAADRAPASLVGIPDAETTDPITATPTTAAETTAPAPPTS
ncbi:hypothetical protein AAFP30_01550 [Gordonia sp. CPCC 205515]|uniref:hypothetical protein n=1 Tax=Gordonia sp. CPCC 205515 TaxID=3140791 RepID=UPI003AF36B14